ncbi:UbiA family prenyltransferase [Quadrisphaera oryzae]|uniref:UbiA family prenyltransferase n=1 Tax=Quadrisphaera TaxID=317661 RepID=UPI001647B113|nr:UbiA family prenyltransferase [Quadrisphaera sp. RL12-1S]MBC3763053.1 UbiA family prenyltransferase [Quadrisphaera sp. RL12-1S]
MGSGTQRGPVRAVLAVVVDLGRACHPAPTVAVTSFAAALAAAAAAPGRRTGTAGRVALAVGLGHLAIGWTNDALDAPLDAAAGRTEKPVAAGRLPRAAVAAAAVLAAAAAVPSSLALDRGRAGAGRLHLAGVVGALGYDLGLKGTLASPLPYLLFFGALPAVATGAAGRPAPRLLCGAAALLGLAAHLANTVPDAEADAATGVRGLPQRLGPRASRTGAALGVALADAVLLLGRRRDLGRTTTALLLAAGAAGALGAAADGRTGFRAVMGAAALSVAGVLTDVAGSRGALLR